MNLCHGYCYTTCKNPALFTTYNTTASIMILCTDPTFNLISPTGTTAQGGRECDKGYWCGAGADSRTPCPRGTYNPDKRVSFPTR